VREEVDSLITRNQLTQERETNNGEVDILKVSEECTKVRGYDE
jgi:hypothetical protein